MGTRLSVPVGGCSLRFLFIYGAFFTDTNRDEASTRDFDKEVRGRDPSWGLR